MTSLTDGNPALDDYPSDELPVEDAPSESPTLFSRGFVTILAAVGLIAAFLLGGLVMKNGSSSSSENIAATTPTAPSATGTCIGTVSYWSDFVANNAGNDAAFNQMLTTLGMQSPEYQMVIDAYPSYISQAVQIGSAKASANVAATIRTACQRQYGVAP